MHLLTTALLQQLWIRKTEVFDKIPNGEESKTESWVIIYESHDSDLIIFVILFANSSDDTRLSYYNGYKSYEFLMMMLLHRKY